jgi:thiamine transport system permease protein
LRQKSFKERNGTLLSQVSDTLNRLSSKKHLKYTIYLVAIAIFFLIILVPPIIGILIKAPQIGFFLDYPELVNASLVAIGNSFVIGLIVAALDLVAGIPLAWMIIRSKNRWISILDTLADLPFIVPTAALGYSLLLFWSSSSGISGLFSASIVSPGYLLVMLLHFTFSFPVVVRVLVGAMMDYKMEFERASRTMGAPPLTAARTVTFPILKPSLLAAFSLAFARSLSETGATFIVAGLVFQNGPVFIQTLKNSLAEGSITQATYEGGTVFTSIILIAISLVIFALIRVVGNRMKLPFGKGLPVFEKKLSYRKGAFSRNTIALMVFLGLILIPSVFVALPAFQAIGTGTNLVDAFTGAGIWASFWQSLVLSYGLGLIVTVLGILAGIPMAILIARKTFGRLLSAILDSLMNVPIIVPSIALGVSLKFFWQGSGVPDFLLLVLAHLAITYPYFVRSMSAAIERIPIELEDASKTLGAKPLTVFKTLILPLTKYSMISGAIIVFTRSVSETGATLAVTSTLQTAPVLIVNWVNSIRGVGTAIAGVNTLTVGLACGLLILFSFIVLFALRLLTKKGKA